MSEALFEGEARVCERTRIKEIVFLESRDKQNSAEFMRFQKSND